ncbi:Six14 [Fusarium oxysporum f. sp. albedinis]|nr:Six14 [Fusarium oxysporum f. sp. albedinis]
MQQPRTKRQQPLNAGGTNGRKLQLKIEGVFNGTELRGLLTSPPGSISFVLSTTSSHLDISASRACDIPASVPLDFP